MKTLLPLVAFGISITGTASGQLLYSPAKTIPTSDAPGCVALRPGGGFVTTIPTRRQVLVYKADGTLERKITLAIRPISIAVKNNGQLVIGGKTNGEVGIYDPSTGKRVGFLGNGAGQALDPVDIAIDRKTHNIYVVDGKWDTVRIYRWDGKPLWTIGSKGTGLGQFSSPVAVAIQPSSGDVFVSDFGNGRIHIFNNGGKYLSAFGLPPNMSWSRPIAPGYLYRNSGVAIDGQGRVLVADIFSGWVQAFKRDGTYLGLCASYGNTAGKLMVPGDIAVDVANRLIATSSIGSATSSTELEVFNNLTAGKLVINTTPEPTERSAVVSAAPFHQSIQKSTHPFQVKIWGVSLDLIDKASIQINRKYEAVGVEHVPGARPGVLEVRFRMTDMMDIIKGGRGNTSATITGTLKGGGLFSGATDLLVSTTTEQWK